MKIKRERTDDDTLLCPNKHQMTYSLRDTVSLYYCDMCKNFITAGDEPGLVNTPMNIFGCRECNYDLCYDCYHIEKNKVENEKEEEKEEETEKNKVENEKEEEKEEETEKKKEKKKRRIPISAVIPPKYNLGGYITIPSSSPGPWKGGMPVGYRQWCQMADQAERKGALHLMGWISHPSDP